MRPLRLPLLTQWQPRAGTTTGLPGRALEQPAPDEPDTKTAELAGGYLLPRHYAIATRPIPAT